MCKHYIDCLAFELYEGCFCCTHYFEKLYTFYANDK